MGDFWSTIGGYLRLLETVVVNSEKVPCPSQRPVNRGFQFFDPPISMLWKRKYQSRVQRRQLPPTKDFLEGISV